jgi:aminoglycoside 6'-N-acetyltransferase I
MLIRKVNNSDKEEWLRMRLFLWPEEAAQHPEEINNFFLNRIKKPGEVFILERNTGLLGGFIELNIRDYAEGSNNEAVPYIEGWYVDADLRRQGFGKKLIIRAEQWAVEKGYNELASDALLENAGSIAAHKALNFIETGRIACFIKKITDK